MQAARIPPVSRSRSLFPFMCTVNREYFARRLDPGTIATPDQIFTCKPTVHASCPATVKPMRAQCLLPDVQGDEGDHPAPSSCAETGRGIGLALVGVGGFMRPPQPLIIQPRNVRTWSRAAMLSVQINRRKRPSVAAASVPIRGSPRVVVKPALISGPVRRWCASPQPNF
jgi:hypothetical protein